MYDQLKHQVQHLREEQKSIYDARAKQKRSDQQ